MEKRETSVGWIETGWRINSRINSRRIGRARVKRSRGTWGKKDVEERNEGRERFEKREKAACTKKRLAEDMPRREAAMSWDRHDGAGWEGVLGEDNVGYVCVPVYQWVLAHPLLRRTLLAAGSLDRFYSRPSLVFFFFSFSFFFSSKVKRSNLSWDDAYGRRISKGFPKGVFLRCFFFFFFYFILHTLASNRVFSLTT